MEEKLLSMAEASKLCPYAQDYLSLLSRKGELKAEKIGKNWYTKIEWLNDYLRVKRPDAIIREKSEDLGKNYRLEKIIRRRQAKFWALALAGVFLVALLAYQYIVKRMNNLENASQNKVFVPEEITKFPNESGGYDVYGSGKVKMGTEGALSP